MLIDKAQAFGLELGSAVGSGQVQISYRLPVDLVFDAVMGEVWRQVEQHGPQRLVIDSITDLQEGIVEGGRQEAGRHPARRRRAAVKPASPAYYDLGRRLLAQEAGTQADLTAMAAAEVVFQKLQARQTILGEPRRREEARALYPGLTAEEARVLQGQARLREGSAEEIAQATGLRRPEVNAALNRLVALSYVIRLTKEGKTVYRPVEQAL